MAGDLLVVFAILGLKEQVMVEIPCVFVGVIQRIDIAVIIRLSISHYYTIHVYIRSTDAVSLDH